MIQEDEAFVKEYVDVIYAATQLMIQTCTYFVGQPNGMPYKVQANWTSGAVIPVEIEADAWEQWSTLIHINNVANCSDMIYAGNYDETTTARIFEHKRRSTAILENRADNSLNHIVKVPEVAAQFLMEFCTNPDIIKTLN
jgi:hypothetical protein